MKRVSRVISIAPLKVVKASWDMGRSWQTLGCGILIMIAVAVTVAILFPILTPGRGSGPNPCVDNVKQLAMAALAYATDYDGRLPPASSWQDALVRGVWVQGGWDNKLFVCPKTNKPYVFNDALAGRDIREIANCEEMPDLWDAIRNSGDIPLFWDAPDDHGTGPHYGGFNVSFLDSHVRWLAEEDFRQLRRDVEKDAPVP